MDSSPTLDQLQVFLAVAEAGSFSAASRALNRAQSVISYSIANLESQLQVPLFNRSGLRQATLTEAGRAMITDARRIVSDLHVLRARAKSLSAGLEAEVALSISTMMPTEVLVSVLRELRITYPTVGVRLTVGELGMVMEMVASGQVDIAFGGALVQGIDTLHIERVGQSLMVPVAAPDHPLADIPGPLSVLHVREEVQLVVTDASAITRGKDFNVLSYKTWKVGDIATKHTLILGGLGWGGLPFSLVRDDLVSGRLIRLDLEAYEQSNYPIYAIRKLDHALGPAATWLVEAFRERLAECPNHADQVAALIARR
jgi:DNA-binding transcriptional LysR family regulator